MSTSIVSEEQINSYIIAHDLKVDEEVLKKARHDHGYALSKIADTFYDRKDYSRAFDWYRLDASKNMSYSQMRVGYMYHKGEGVLVDHKAAMEWYLRAHNNGNVLAKNNIDAMCNELRISPDNGGPKKYLNDKSYSIEDMEMKYVLMEKDMKEQKEKTESLERKLYVSDEKLQRVEDENRIIKQEVKALKLMMMVMIDKRQPLETNTSKDTTYQRKEEEAVSKGLLEMKVLDSIIEKDVQEDNLENDLYYD